MDQQSCVASRLERYVSLTDAEKAFIAKMEADEREMSAGETICRAGDPSQTIFILKLGWVVVRSRPERGRSQILHIHLPGEVIGLAELGSHVAPHDVAMQTSGVLCPFPRSGVAGLFDELPRLAALLTALSNLDQVALRDRIFALSRLTAEQRMIYFMLQLSDRLAVANVGAGNRFYLPFNQSELGDILGLTSVYVNKLLRKLVMANQIEVDKPYIRLLRREEMERQVGFQTRFSRIETGWFPEAR